MHIWNVLLDEPTHSNYLNGIALNCSNHLSYLIVMVFWRAALLFWFTPTSVIANIFSAGAVFSKKALNTCTTVPGQQ